MANTLAATGKPRREYIDALRGLGIILVVGGHFLESYRYADPAFNALWECIYMFHMALLCVCSGLVAKFSLYKLVCQQVWLYLVSQALILRFRMAFLPEELETLTTAEAFLLPWRHMWYLYSLIFWELTVPLLRLARDKGRLPGALLAMGIAVAVSLLSGLRSWDWELGRVLSYYPFFAFGFLFSPQLDALARAARRRWWLGLAAFAAAAPVYLHWFMAAWKAPETVYEGARLFNAGMYEGNYTMFSHFVWGLVGLLTTLALVFIAGRSKWLAGLGRRTLPVYILHMFLYAWVIWLKVYDAVNQFDTPIIAAWLVVLTGGCVCFLASVPVYTAFSAVANVWYKGVPALVHWLQGRDLKEN